MTDILLDRSRLEQDARCPRSRWWGYEFDNTGLEGDRLAFALLTGLAVHRGIELLLTQPEKGVEHAVTSSLDDYQLVLREAGLLAQIDAPWAEIEQPLAREAKDNLAIAEALIRLADLRLLPKLLAEYEITAVEHEVDWSLTLNGCDFKLMTRSDAYGPRRSDGAIFVHNWKTVGRPDAKWAEAWRYDQQTLTEAAALEAELGETVHGTIIHGLVKGDRAEWPKGSGRWYFDSPLTWCWYREADLVAGTEAEFYPRYEWTCTEAHVQKNGRKCDGNRTHKLSGVVKRPVGEVYPGGIAEWLKALDKDYPVLLDWLLLTQEPILRSEYEVERWKRQALPREAEIAAHREAAHADESVLDRVFPMNTSACVRPFRCGFIDLCHGTAAAAPLESGYRRRTPNHKLERERQLAQANLKGYATCWRHSDDE